MELIPKKIHYCWFGGKPLPKLAKKCIASWKKFLPDYEIIEWNENNYDVRKIPYIAEAYDAKKYAFVSDYARFDILNEYGGIYFDTDVEVIKDMTPILARGAYAGIESSGNGAALAAGLGIASPAARAIYKEILDSYKGDHFIKPDGTMNLKTVVLRVSEIFEKYGFKDKSEIQEVAGFTIYPEEYFCPMSTKDGKIRITENTYTIHHYAYSWVPAWRRYGRKIALVMGGDEFKEFIKGIVFRGSKG